MVLIFFFVPETFWDRTPRPRARSKQQRPSLVRNVSDLMHHSFRGRHPAPRVGDERVISPAVSPRPAKKTAHVGFVDDTITKENSSPEQGSADAVSSPANEHSSSPGERVGDHLATWEPPSGAVTEAHGSRSGLSPLRDVEVGRPASLSPIRPNSEEQVHAMTPSALYTHRLREQGPIPYRQTLRFLNGRLAKEKWHRVAMRPFILFAYPAVLWSAMVYALSVGWLIVLSESVAVIFENRGNYNFSSLGTGLIYISPFIGGILGTAVAGRVSDILVRWMARRNGGIYEPEYRLVMAIPVALATATGLMGFGWSTQEKDRWIVPTVFFGLISFGCTLGSTTAITFCVDSYRQYAGEALVTLNFSKSAYFPPPKPHSYFLI